MDEEGFAKNKMVNPQIESTASAAATTTGGNRKPMNAFFLFCKRHRALVKEMYPNLENRNITKILGEWWSTLSMDEKEPFNALAVTYKEHLMKEKPSNIVSAHKKPQQSVENDQMQPLPPHNQSNNPGECNDKSHDNAPQSRGSSGSSSPEPSSGGTNTSSAPKPFKKRYLAAEKAKLGGVESSVETKNACEALLQLAEGGNIKLFHKKEGDTKDKSVNNGKANPYDNVKESAQFSVLRNAVWAQVAKTIMTQEEEKGKNANSNNGDTPINLSSQCLIPNSTIIEHIIENILNDNGDKDEVETATTASAKSESNSSSNNVTKNGTTSTTGESTEQIKEKIYQSLKDDMMRRTGGGSKDSNNDLSALWKMLPNPMMNMTSSKQKNGSTNNSNISALGLSTNFPPKTNAANSAKDNSKAHSAPASQSGSGAPSPRGDGDFKNSAVVVTAAATTDHQPSVSVTLVQTTEDLPLNLSTTPPQTPAGPTMRNGVAVTITTSSPAKRKLLEEDEDDIRRSSRACKGRRYKEFKDSIGKRGRGRAAGKSDSELSQHSEDEQQPPTTSSSHQQSSPPFVSFSNPSVPSKSEDYEVKNHFSSNSLVTIAKPITTTSTHFDLEKALTAIPALRPEEFQKRIQVNRQQRSHHESSSNANSAATVVTTNATTIISTATAVNDHAMTSGPSSGAKRFKGAASARQRSASGGGNTMVS